jgi:hypothetical protein
MFVSVPFSGELRMPPTRAMQRERNVLLAKMAKLLNGSYAGERDPATLKLLTS